MPDTYVMKDPRTWTNSDDGTNGVAYTHAVKLADGSWDVAPGWSPEYIRLKAQADAIVGDTNG